MKNSFRIFRRIKPGPGITVFILFFGISVLEAIRTRDWGDIAFWMALGIMFLVADSAIREARDK
jgi:hypothetical protein